MPAGERQNVAPDLPGYMIPFDELLFAPRAPLGYREVIVPRFGVFGMTRRRDRLREGSLVSARSAARAAERKAAMRGRQQFRKSRTLPTPLAPTSPFFAPGLRSWLMRPNRYRAGRPGGFSRIHPSGARDRGLIERIATYHASQHLPRPRNRPHDANAWTTEAPGVTR